jgi:2-polyprenyl-3-methyl-5-hydroxy-6-metoxy-1,4-benzoquinol methylase
MKCKICGNSENNNSYTVKEMMYGTKDKFDYFQCSNCECLQITDIPNNLEDYYPTNYYSYKAPKSLKRKNPFKFYRNKLRDRYSLFKKGFLRKLLYNQHPKDFHPMLARVKPTEQSSILDVGCGNGKILLKLADMGFRNLQGADPFIKKDTILENGVKILKQDIHEVVSKWDIIMFNHSYEHVTDPAKTLESTFKALNDDGVCIIRIPTVSSHVWGKYRENWVGLDAPRHLFLHSIKSIKYLAEQANLTLEDVAYDSTDFQFWGSEQYLKGISLFDPKSYKVNPKNSIFTKSQITEFKNQADELNNNKQGDSCAFFLRKKR